MLHALPALTYVLNREASAWQNTPYLSNDIPKSICCIQNVRIYV